MGIIEGWLKSALDLFCFAGNEQYFQQVMGHNYQPEAQPEGPAAAAASGAAAPVVPVGQAPDPEQRAPLAHENAEVAAQKKQNHKNIRQATLMLGNCFTRKVLLCMSMLFLEIL